MLLANDKLTLKFIFKAKHFCLKNKLVLFFFVSHVFFAIFLGRMFAFAPDEKGYLFTFNNVYTLPINTIAQMESGWITTPTFFLWIAYLPAKIMNLAGVPDYLSIRILSIAITTLSLYLLLKINHNINLQKWIPKQLIFFSFFIPSVFLWTSTGLREAFINFEITLFLLGLNYFFLRKYKKAVFLIFVSSYGLLSTKAYLWVLLIISLFVFLSITLMIKAHKKYFIKIIGAAFLGPLILFSATTSQYALDFLFGASISESGSRSGYSITQFGNYTFHGDYTLIELHFYLLKNPDSAFTQVFEIFKLDEKVESLWNEKLQSGLISEGKKIRKDTSSLNGQTLKPGVFTEPWTMLLPAFNFIAGPLPFIGEAGIATAIASLESPLWWFLYTLVIYQFYRFKRFKLFKDPVIMFTLIFLAGEVALNALIQVNLGTSFRHRSILLVPLVFLYVRITQRAHELSNADSRQTT